MAIFAIYQALPSSWVPDRNDQLIFGDIGFVFFANVFLNALWLPIFKGNTPTRFILSAIDLSLVLCTCVYMMMKTSRADSLNLWEYISMQIGFSIYSGWVTAATILNICNYFKSIGYADPKIDEEKVTIILLWIAALIYTTATFREKNPWYGLVFVWVLFSIKSRACKDGSEVVHGGLKILFRVYVMVLLAFTTYLALLANGK